MFTTLVDGLGSRKSGWRNVALRFWLMAAFILASFFSGKGTAYGKQFYIKYLSEVTKFAAETSGKDSATTAKRKWWAFWQ